MSLLQNSNAISSGGYNLESSLRFRGSNSAYLEWTPTSAGSLTTWTWSGWFKISDLSSELELFQGGITNYNDSHFRFEPAASLKLVMYDGTAQSGALIFNRKFRDPSAWYHLVVVWDSTNATSTNRFRAYINGERETSFSTETYPSLNAITSINKANKHLIGSSRTTGRFFNGYMTEINFVDGQALTADDFGEYDGTTGVWKPKEYLGTYGTNGFYLPFKETQQATGFNTVLYTGNGGTQSITGVGFSPDLVWIKSRSNAFGHGLFDTVRGANQYLGSETTTAETSYTTMLTSFDSDGFSLGGQAGVNGAGVTEVAWCWDAGNDNTTGSELVTNGTFDSGTTGWTAVNSSISGTNQKLNATYSSSGAYVYQEVTGLTVGQKYMLSFQSTGSNDFIRILRDAQTEALGGTFISFLGGNAITTSGLNQIFFEAPTTTVYINFNIPNGGTIIIDDISMKEVSYSGTIPSYYKSNPATGFSIVTYTGAGTLNASVGHGLNSAPKVIIVKNRTSSANWAYFTNTIDGSSDVLYLNLTNAKIDTTVNVSTSDVFYTAAGNETGASGQNYVAYCFSEVAGYSKFGSYTGTGASGNSVTGLGFRPAFLMVKNTTQAKPWVMLDIARNPDYNDVNLILRADDTLDESTVSPYYSFDSDGFTVNSVGSFVNASGDNYIYMAFADTRDAQFNFDASDNKNNWTANNINSNASSETTYDIMNDVPTLTDEDTANFATLNPIDIFETNQTTSDGNLKFTCAAQTNWDSALSTMGVSSGKYYYEVKHESGTYNRVMVGICDVAQKDSSTYTGNTSNGYGYLGTNGSKYNNSTASAYGDTFTVGDIIGVAVDLDNGAIYFSKNGTWQNSGDPTSGATATGAAYTGLSGTYLLGLSLRDVSATTIATINYGQRPFAYTPPTGYKKLNTYNLPDSAIKDGSQYMNTVTYTGTGTTNSITGVGFSPDLLWLKDRTAANNHNVFDTVRGIGASNSQRLVTNTLAAEVTYSTITSVNSDGFVLGDGLGNQSGNSNVAWLWRGSDSSAVSNTDGTITSTVSANTDSGFSVVTYSGNGTNGATVGHGLGIAPKMVIVKQRNGSTYSWTVHHDSLTSGYVIALESTSAQFSRPTAFNSTVPDANTFTLGTDLGTNSSSGTYVAYCFAEVEGFSKIGSYTGNGSTDGPFIYTGFKPAFILWKLASSTSSWAIWDGTRATYNPINTLLFPDQNVAESSGNSAYNVDLLSNGFKWRTSNSQINGSGSTYIYMAFAENPFKNSLAR